MGKYAVFSDIHGNLQSLQAVHADMQLFDIRNLLILGDLVDYGMQSNEVVRYIEINFQNMILCNLWGNHERAIILSDFERFSSDRGAESAKWTASVLEDSVKEYLEQKLQHQGLLDFNLDGLRCLAVHGSLEDHYWKPIEPENVRGDYQSYDVVFSGHSHYSHVFSKFYDADSPVMRNKHMVQFINPGSIGQPRNHHPHAQYAIFDSETRAVSLRSVPYNVEEAMDRYGTELDLFYRDRLMYGI